MFDPEEMSVAEAVDIARDEAQEESWDEEECRASTAAVQRFLAAQDVARAKGDLAGMQAAADILMAEQAEIKAEARRRREIDGLFGQMMSDLEG
jgi:hypothetical protein